MRMRGGIFIGCFFLEFTSLVWLAVKILEAGFEDFFFER